MRVSIDIQQTKAPSVMSIDGLSVDSGLLVPAPLPLNSWTLNQPQLKFSMSTNIQTTLLTLDGLEGFFVCCTSRN